MSQNQERPKPLTAMRSFARAKEFTNAAIALDIDAVLDDAKYPKNIGESASLMAGKSIALEGDDWSEGIVKGAYEDIYELMGPTLRADGTPAARELFYRDATVRTIAMIAGMTDDTGMKIIAHEYSEESKHLRVTPEGLVPLPDFALPENLVVPDAGCPFAGNGTGAQFSRFTGRIVDTYIRAHDAGMPKGWLQRVNRSLNRS